MGKKSPLFPLSPIVISPAERVSFPSEEAINESRILCWLQNDSLINPPPRITIRFFLRNATSFLNQKVFSFMKIALLFSGIFRGMSLAASIVFRRSPSLTPINHFPKKAFLFLHLSRQLELTAVKKAWVQQTCKERGYSTQKC